MTKLELTFWEFHRNNPVVYELFKRFTNEVIAAGHLRYSSDAVLHRIRWHTKITLREREDYKINDNYSAYYARLWLADHPNHPDFFETRALACERRAA
jgi:hypothetical protein